MNKPGTSYLASHDGHRGAIIKRPVNCHQSFDKGVASVQAWLSNDNTGWLWANLIAERDALPQARRRPHGWGGGKMSGAAALLQRMVFAPEAPLATGRAPIPGQTVQLVAQFFTAKQGRS